MNYQEIKDKRLCNCLKKAISPLLWSSLPDISKEQKYLWSQVLQKVKMSYENDFYGKTSC